MRPRVTRISPFRLKKKIHIYDQSPLKFRPIIKILHLIIVINGSNVACVEEVEFGGKKVGKVLVEQPGRRR
jgi:hypothetical protein